jgi:type I restriction-modification system DNA methylase subunit
MEDIFITREDLRDYIHDIHNFLRNNGAGYGQTGVKIFSVFYGLKLIKPFIHTLGLTPNQLTYLDFDELVKKSKGNDEIIRYIDENVLEELFNLKISKTDKNKDLGNFIFYQIPRDLKDNVWKELVHRIEILPVGFQKDRKVNLSGKVWEYFVGRDAQSIEELGAYFTDRHITDFIFNDLLKIQLKTDKNIPTMIDPFGGSGGFTLGYANYMKHNFEDIDWKTNVNNIFHYDMEEAVVNMTGLEMCAITGFFPMRNDNYIRGNSFKSEFNNLKCDYVISNPPYGGDKITKTAEQIKRDKLVEYIKKNKEDERTDILKIQLKELTKQTNDFKKQSKQQTVNLLNCSKRIKKRALLYNIDVAKDKEACSLILLMDLLNETGTCCAVLKEGVFFDGKYSTLRGKLIENYNITDIISVPKSAFENTSTKTSIIKFTAGSKTNKIKFSELVVENELDDVFEIKEDGKVNLTKNKGEIKSVFKKDLCHATYKQLISPTIVKDKKGVEKERYDYSLNYIDYKDNTVFCPEGFELKKLGDICDFKRGTRITDKITIKTEKEGEFINPVYGAGSIQGFSNSYNRDGDSCILSRVGGINSKNCCKIICGKFFVSDASFTLELKENNVNLQNYIFNYMQMNYDNIFTSRGSGSVQVTISAETLGNTQIPIPKDITTLKKELTILQKLHQQISSNTELIPQKEKAICDLIKKLTDEGNEGVDYESKKLGDVCEIKSGKPISKENRKGTSSSKSVKTCKINGIKCIKTDNKYYDFNDQDKLIAITNDEGKVELIEEETEEYELITIGKKDYILIDEDVYTIADDKPDELYGTYKNGKFKLIPKNDKIIVKGRNQEEKTLEELEAELEM